MVDMIFSLFEFFPLIERVLKTMPDIALWDQAWNRVQN